MNPILQSRYSGSFPQTICRVLFFIYCLLLFLLLQICLQNDDLSEDDDTKHSSSLLGHRDWFSAKARYETEYNSLFIGFVSTQ